MQTAGDNMFLLWLLLGDTGDHASLAFSTWLCVPGDLAPVCRGLKVLDMQIYTRVNTCPQLSSGGQISAAEFRDQVLVTGAETGELRLHTQADTDRSSVMKCRSVVRTHTRAIAMIAMAGERVVAASLDCAVTVIRLQGDGAVMVTHLLQVHTCLFLLAQRNSCISSIISVTELK